MLSKKALQLFAAASISSGLCSSAFAAGGPLGIDQRLPYDNSGIWKRHDQLLLEDLMAATVVGGALWQGDQDRLGRTFWQSLDASFFGGLTATIMKPVFGRERPIETDDPNQWFKGHGHNSFPSGEVTFVTSAVTPFVLEYGPDHPSVYALEALPLYDAVARMKVQGHWQTDVLAGYLIGTGMGYYAHRRDTPWTIQWVPGGWRLGLHTKF
jgi:undecaprenyl-diphosphatase